MSRVLALTRTGLPRTHVCRITMAVGSVATEACELFSVAIRDRAREGGDVRHCRQGTDDRRDTEIWRTQHHPR